MHVQYTKILGMPKGRSNIAALSYLRFRRDCYHYSIAKENSVVGEQVNVGRF